MDNWNVHGNIKKGKKGEDIAADYLKEKGFKILERNWRYSIVGEIDIIAVDQKTLVFIEVKARSSANFGQPIEAVDKIKMGKMKNMANIYLSENPAVQYSSYRFDAIGIILGKEPEITYYRNIYQF